MTGALIEASYRFCWVAQSSRDRPVFPESGLATRSCVRQVSGGVHTSVLMGGGDGLFAIVCVAGCVESLIRGWVPSDGFVWGDGWS